MERLDRIRDYAQQRINELTEELDFNKNFFDTDYIEGLAIDREYWRDIIKIINNNNEDLFIDLPF